MVVEGLSGLGQVAEEGVEPVETLGAHDVSGSKDNDSSENIKTEVLDRVPLESEIVTIEYKAHNQLSDCRQSVAEVSLERFCSV